MEEVKFSVAAKAARLIGRENIADVDGALVELIKNSYDADATCVLVKLQIPFPDVPNVLDLTFVATVLSEEELSRVASFYDEEDGKLVKKAELTEEEENELKNILFSYDKIVIADNGYGMTEDVVRTTWMHIGTSDKEDNILSPKGRVKTGAKGIGRFALDKLSKYSLMYTKSTSSDYVIQWSMNWEQFVSAKLIEDVKAEVQEKDNSYVSFVKEEFKENEKNIKAHDWTTGTMIVLNPIREPWSRRLFRKVNTNLNSINPIGSVDKFEVVINNEYYHEFDYCTEQVAIDKEDFDYRIIAEYDGKEKITVKLLRNEVDLSKKDYG